MADSGSDGIDVVARLRAATGDAHARLDARLNILDVLADPDGRRRLVGRFYGLHAGAEPVLAPLLRDLEGLAFPDRSRAPALARDAAALGLDPERLPLCPMAPPRSVPEALGIFYVLEGSTLGGRIIRREMAARGHDGTGLDFLDPYGTATGERWRAFLAVLQRESPPGDDETGRAVAEGGVAGFGHAEAWLCANA